MGTLPQSHSPSKKLCKVSSAKRGMKKQWPCRKWIFLNGQMLFPFSLHRFASMVQWLHKQTLTALYNTLYTLHVYKVVLFNLWNRNKWLHPVKWKPSVRRKYWDSYLRCTYTLVSFTSGGTLNQVSYQIWERHLVWWKKYSFLVMV